MFNKAQVLPSSFDKYGLLPPKDYEVTFSQLRKSLLIQGVKNKDSEWNIERRGRLVDNLEILAKELWEVGVENIYIDGSFLENKDHPNDIDGYFECDIKEFASGNLQSKLNLLNEHKAWTWSPKDRRLDINTGKLKIPMWHIYRVELFPHYDQGSGVVDKFGYELKFPSLFRITRDGRQKGIIKIKEK